MAQRILILVGTKKGAFILSSGPDRRSWALRGPFCEAWPLNHVIADPASGTIYAGGGNEWFGPAVWQSTDLGATWTHSSDGLAYQAGDQPIKSVWSLAPSAGGLYAGVEPAGLFRSADGGQSWRHVAGLREHPSRPNWQPGGGGLILHSLVPHPTDAKRLWIGISAAGVFHTEDGGDTWQARNQGTRCDYLPEEQRYPEYGQCVHCLVMAPGMPDRLYQQNHCGMYRSEDGGQHWSSIEQGCLQVSGFPPRRIRAIRRRCICCRSTAISPAGTYLTGRPRSGGPAIAARPGRRCATACRSRTHSLACCVRRWPPIVLSRRGYISAPTRARCSPATTRATVGPASLSICLPSTRWRHWSSRHR